MSLDLLTTTYSDVDEMLRAARLACTRTLREPGRYRAVDLYSLARAAEVLVEAFESAEHSASIRILGGDHRG